LPAKNTKLRERKTDKNLIEIFFHDPLIHIQHLTVYISQSTVSGPLPLCVFAPLTLSAVPQAVSAIALCDGGQQRVVEDFLFLFKGRSVSLRLCHAPA
jgi:hypothetical protein